MLFEGGGEWRSGHMGSWPTFHPPMSMDPYDLKHMIMVNLHVEPIFDFSLLN